MALIKENRSICIQCEGAFRFCTSSENEKRRHVGIVHGKETFSSLRCGKCDRKYYDFGHFAEHLQVSPECRKDSWMIKPEPLTAHLEMAFAALVEQMMRPVETDQRAMAPISGGNADGKMDRISGETWKRSMASSMSMDGTKRKRMEDTNASDDPSSTGRRTGRSPTGCDLNSVNEQFKLRPAIVRREYCMALIDKFTTAGKLQCQLCSTECVVLKERGWLLTRCTSPLIQHALGHLKMPIYHCQICNVTKSSSEAIWRHGREHHQGTEKGYEDCSDQYHREIMEMVDQCFDSHKKRPVEQGEHVSTTPGQNIEDKRVTGRFKLRPAVVRRQYCLDLIDKFSITGKLQCQLCSAKCGIVHRRDTNPQVVTTATVQHALGHMKRPIYCCRICRITKFTYIAILRHIGKHHPTNEEGYEDCADQYHQEIMDTLRLCFHVDKDKSVVEEVEKKLAIPRRLYDSTRSPLYNERLHHVRSLAARYSNQIRIACRLCSKMCTVNSSSGLVATRNHVFVHVNKDIFQCILCGTYCKSYLSFKTHILNLHQLKSTKGAYVDYSDKYHLEFVNMLGKCFDPDSGNGVVEAGSGIHGGTSNNATLGNGKATYGIGDDIDRVGDFDEEGSQSVPVRLKRCDSAI